MRFFIILIGVILLSSSCKKSNSNSELDLAVISNKVKNLKSMQNALNIMSELRDVSTKKFNPNLTDDAKVQDYIRKINSSKSKQELVSVFNSAGIRESDELLNKLELINKNILEIYFAVPELKQLTKQDRTQIFTEIYKEHYLINKLKLQSEFLGKLNLSKNMFVEDDWDCYNEFNINCGICDSGYNYSMLAVWADVAYIGLITSEVGGAIPAAGYGLIMSAILYFAREECRTISIASFTACTQ